MTTDNKGIKFWAGLLVGNFMFYLSLIVTKKLAGGSWRQVVVEIVRQFGPAEFFDWFPVRPLCLWFFCAICESQSAGTVWGHGVADGLFYVMGFGGVPAKALAFIRPKV